MEIGSHDAISDRSVEKVRGIVLSHGSGFWMLYGEDQESGQGDGHRTVFLCLLQPQFLPGAGARVFDE